MGRKATGSRLVSGHLQGELRIKLNITGKGLGRHSKIGNQCPQGLSRGTVHLSPWGIKKRVRPCVLRVYVNNQIRPATTSQFSHFPEKMMESLFSFYPPQSPYTKNIKRQITNPWEGSGTCLGSQIRTQHCRVSLCPCNFLSDIPETFPVGNRSW